MHRYMTLITFILTLSAVFVDASMASHGPENDDYYGGDDYFLESDDGSANAFDPIDIVYPTTQLNSTSSTLSRMKKALPVKGVTCSGLAAGRNITGAVNAFVDWGETYLVGKRNWHWAGMGGYGEYAIVWMCNCNWRKVQVVNCWELNEALRLLEDKCGPGQGGRVRLHGKREIGRHERVPQRENKTKEPGAREPKPQPEMV
ncbi:hypothetical protein CHU98_g8730 [Xylaria longipes]|nr:hypothetical protein CHU98_g8730 [Xylaria longipes]